MGCTILSRSDIMKKGDVINYQNGVKLVVDKLDGTIVNNVMNHEDDYVVREEIEHNGYGVIVSCEVCDYCISVNENCITCHDYDEFVGNKFYIPPDR